MRRGKMLYGKMLYKARGKGLCSRRTRNGPIGRGEQKTLVILQNKG